MTTPAVVIRPIELLPKFVNHKASSGRTVICPGAWIPGPVKNEITPAVVMRPMAMPNPWDPAFVNDGAPSGPATMSKGPLMPKYSCIRLAFSITEPELWGADSRLHAGGLGVAPATSKLTDDEMRTKANATAKRLDPLRSTRPEIFLAICSPLAQSSGLIATVQRRTSPPGCTTRYTARIGQAQETVTSEATTSSAP